MKTASSVFALLLVAGCASSFSKAKQAASSAPDWYEAAKTEIIGEGYPNLGSTPELSRQEQRLTQNATRLSTSEVREARRLFTTNPRASIPVSTQTEMRALAADLSAKLAQSGPAPTGTQRDLFLTPADIEGFRELFRRAEQR